MIMGAFDGPDGATPLDPDDIGGLIPTWIANRDDLNSAEQENIARAVLWASSRGVAGSIDGLMTEKVMKNLHKRMFGDVWKWAGEFRRHNTNIGSSWIDIPVRLRDLLEDVSFQTGNREEYPWHADELAIRFHHRLVLIHPFPNGNGRHSRLAADLLVVKLGEQHFTWGAKELTSTGSSRSAYLEALRYADATQDFAPLVAFARS